MKRILSPALLLLAAIIWGLAFSAQKSAEAVPPFTLGAARSFIAGAFLIIVIIIFDKLLNTGRRLFSKEKKIDLNRAELLGGVICGIILAAASFFQQAGMAAGADAGKASFITALYVVLVPIYALALKKKAGINVWISVVIAAVGFYLLCIEGAFAVAREDLIVMVCSLIFPFHILAIDHFSPKCDGIRMSCVQFFVCAAVNLILALITEMPIAVEAIKDNILSLVYLGIMSSGVAYTLQIIGQKGTPPAAASVILSLESVFGVIGSAIILGETMKPREYIGAGVVFIAVIISQLDMDALLKKKQKRSGF